MASNKVPFHGSERRPVGTRVGEVPKDEVVDVSVILKPKARPEAPQAGSAPMSRQEFAARFGADPAAIDQVKILIVVWLRHVLPSVKLLFDSKMWTGIRSILNSFHRRGTQISSSLRNFTNRFAPR